MNIIIRKAVIFTHASMVLLFGCTMLPNGERSENQAVIVAPATQPMATDPEAKLKASDSTTGSFPVIIERTGIIASDLFDARDQGGSLTAQGKATLDELSETMHLYDNKILISVRNEAIGTDKYNDRLAIRRAEAVKVYLKDKGVEANRIYTESNGKRRAINKIQSGEASRILDIELISNRKIDAPAQGKYFDNNKGRIEVASGKTASDFDYPVMFGTSRRRVVRGVGYSDDRDYQLNYGRVFVKIPRNHRVGSLGSLRGSWIGDDPALEIRIVESLVNESSFISLAKKEIAPVTGPESGYVLVFIHGYNNSFRDAALRAAQLGVDLGVPPNNMFMFSWASRGATLDYTYDEATVDASEVYLSTFVETVARIANGRKIHVIAHSMGNRALLRVIAAASANSLSRKRIRFGQLILVAADVDRDLFAQLAPNYLAASDRTTVYLSPYDFAVRQSQGFHDYPRVGCGLVPQVLIGNIDSIVSTIPTDFPWHAYYSETLPILTDIKNLILRGQPARIGAEWRTEGGYWVVGGPPNQHKVICKNMNTLRID